MRKSLVNYSATGAVRPGTPPRRASVTPVLLAALLLLGCCSQIKSRLADPDTWWHIAVGQRIAATRSLPTTDPYSFTMAGLPWVATEWVGDVLIGLAASGGKLRPLWFFLVALCASYALLLFYYSYQRSRNWLASFVATSVLLPMAAPCFSLRPQLIGYDLFIGMLIILEKFRCGRAWSIWLLPPLFLLWVNTHGTVALGILFLILVWVGGFLSLRTGALVTIEWSVKQRLDLGFIVLICLVAVMITPYGTRLVAYPLTGTFQPVGLANIQEWQPMSGSTWFGALFFGLILALFLTQILLQLHHRLDDLILLIVAAFMACIHWRFVILFTIALSPVLASILARWAPPIGRSRHGVLLEIVALVLVGFGAATLAPSEPGLQQLVDREFPAAAVEYLQSHCLGQRVLNQYGWGGYLIWRSRGEQKVFIDGRSDLYEYGGVLSDYIELIRGQPDAPFLLRKYHVETCLLRPKEPLSTLLRVLPDWRVAYSDSICLVFVHAGRSR